ncbi:MAG TPA: ThuA domain-containing protein [Thermoanaerobaculia bacterium]|nr:ThuA domain-containing protein [Thermoanaerobaculia bacterium]
MTPALASSGFSFACRPESAAASVARLLVFTRTTGFRHDSIPDGIAAIRHVAAESGLSVDATEDPSAFSDENLASYRVVVFLLTTGDVLVLAAKLAL